MVQNVDRYVRLDYASQALKLWRNVQIQILIVKHFVGDQNELILKQKPLTLLGGVSGF